MRICTKDPQEMAPAERFAEVTDILARATLRMQESKQNQGNEKTQAAGRSFPSRATRASLKGARQHAEQKSLAGLQSASKRSCSRKNNSKKAKKREV